MPHPVKGLCDIQEGSRAIVLSFQSRSYLVHNPMTLLDRTMTFSETKLVSWNHFIF